MNLDIRHFKNELTDYNYLVSKISRLKDLQLELDTKRGLHAIRYDKEAVDGSPDPLTAQLNKLNDIEKAEYLERELNKLNERLGRIDRFIKSSMIGESIKKIHCLGTSTYEKEAKDQHMGIKTLKRRVNKEIFEFLLEEEYGGL